MKSLILAALRMFGLAPASHLAALQTKLADVKSHTARLRERVEEVQRARRDAEQAAAAARQGLEERLARMRTESKESEVRADQASQKAQERVDHWKTRAAELVEQLRTLRNNVEAAERTSRQVRDQLMLTEVKLDLLEAAVNTLDARQRRGSSPRS